MLFIFFPFSINILFKDIFFWRYVTNLYLRLVAMNFTQQSCCSLTCPSRIIYLYIYILIVSVYTVYYSVYILNTLQLASLSPCFFLTRVDIYISTTFNRHHFHRVIASLLLQLIRWTLVNDNL